MSESDEAVNTADFHFKPIDWVTAILSPELVDTSRTALRRAGVDDSAVDVLVGEEG